VDRFQVNVYKVRLLVCQLQCLISTLPILCFRSLPLLSLFYHSLIFPFFLISDIAIFVLKRAVKLQLTNFPFFPSVPICSLLAQQNIAISVLNLAHSSVTWPPCHKDNWMMKINKLHCYSILPAQMSELMLMLGEPQNVSFSVAAPCCWIDACQMKCM